MKHRWMAAALCFALLCACGAAAEPAMQAWAGYDGVMLAGRYFPLVVEITADDAPVEDALRVDIGVSGESYDTLVLPVSVPAGETRSYRLTVRPLINQRTFDVTLANDPQLRATAVVAQVVDEDALVIGVLGDDAALAQALGEVEHRDVFGNEEDVAAILLSPEQLAQNEREWSAFDALVIDADASLADEDAARIADWQREGGILVRREAETPDVQPGEAAAEVTQSPADEAAQIFAQVQNELADGERISRDQRAYPYSASINENLTVEGNLLPAAAVLALYVLVAGVGAYLLLRRVDRSKRLWLAVPTLAVVTCGALFVMGEALGINQPMSTSVHVTCYDVDGRVQVHELAMVTYAGQGRKEITTANHLPLERQAYTYFQKHVNNLENAALRDVCTLGEQAAIELEGKADWLRRSLVVDSDATPEGAIRASAHMDEDGLHVNVENGTDVTIDNAMLFTKLGYAQLGDLAAGATAQAMLERVQDVPIDEDGDLRIAERQMMPIELSLYAVTQAAVYPESAQDEDFDTKSLSRAERQRRNENADIWRLGCENQGAGLSCVIVGETPQIACETLLVDGEPIARSAQRSVLVCDVPFETVSESGWFYMPNDMFVCRQVRFDEQGVPALDAPYESLYLQQSEWCFGFSLAGVDVSGIEEIRLNTGFYSGPDGWPEGVTLEIYDAGQQCFVALEQADPARIDGETAQRAVTPAGELILRMTGEALSERAIRASIIVEGRSAEEGGQEQ